jgi:hypothetical protein
MIEEVNLRFEIVLVIVAYYTAAEKKKGGDVKKFILFIEEGHKMLVKAFFG